MHLSRLTFLAILMVALLPWGAYSVARTAPAVATVMVQQGTVQPAHRCRTGILPGCGQLPAILPADPVTVRAATAHAPTAADLPLPQGRQPPVSQPPPRLA